MINIRYRRPIEDFDSAGNDPDFPQEWLECLGYNLAVRIAPQFGKTAPQEVVMMAVELKESLQGWDQEEESIIFSGGSRGWG